jgi:hypothetical protein
MKLNTLIKIRALLVHEAYEAQQEIAHLESTRMQLAKAGKLEGDTESDLSWKIADARRRLADAEEAQSDFDAANYTVR